MIRFRRPLIGLLSLVIVFTASPDGRLAELLASQETTTTTKSLVSPAQAAPYIGDWSAAVTSPMGPATFTVSVKADAGKVIATVANGMFPAATASEISLSGKNLFLKYASDFQGMLIPGLVAMTPEGPDMLLTISILDGQVEMAGRATKGDAASATPGPSGRGAANAAARGQTGRGGAPPVQSPAAGPSSQPQVARVADLMQMMSALPDRAPATPARPRRVLVLAKAAGFVHSSIPLAARTVEALGQKTGAWTTVITYTAADITDQNLQQYDAIFLASTTGTFLDDPADPAVTAARRKALLDFVRGGKGLAGIHAATDSYHGSPPAAPASRRATARRWRGAALAGVQPVDRRLLQVPLVLPDADRRQDRRPRESSERAVHVAERDDRRSAAAPLLRGGRGLHVQRGVVVAGARARADQHRLRKMPAEVKAQEPAPQRADHDYALSYLQREGKGRIFVQVLGHDESIYKMPSMLAHILAGIQYAIGDLQADDSPTSPAKQ